MTTTKERTGMPIEEMRHVAAARGLRRILTTASRVAMLGAGAVFAAHQGGTSILIIGDSNTEYGRIAVGLTDTLQRYYGVPGTGYGYLPVFSTFLALRDSVYKGVKVDYDAGWTHNDFDEGKHMTPPTWSPGGHWLASSTAGATATISTTLDALDVYWLAQTNGGSFSIAIDGVVMATVATAGSTAVRRTSVTGLARGKHVATLKVVSGAVNLEGFDAHVDSTGRPRSVVHNWGNGYASTQDFVGVDSLVFASALRQLSPDVVVILLGTNDYGNDNRTAALFKTNLKRIIQRVQAAGVTRKILLVSTFETKDPPALLTEYATTSWPQAASETGVAYWDMYTWFGAYSSATMQDSKHCNLAGGKKIGIEMLNQILKTFPTTATSPRGTRATPPDRSSLDLRTGSILLRGRDGARPSRVDGTIRKER